MDKQWILQAPTPKRQKISASAGTLQDIDWHGKRKLCFVSDNNEAVKTPRSRSQTKLLNWSLCLFCQQRKANGIVKLTSIQTFDCGKTIEQAAVARADENLLRHIRGIDLVAVGAKYHQNCRAQYVGKRNLIFACPVADLENEAKSIYAEAYSQLVQEIVPHLEAGRALLMTSILETYQGYLTELGCTTAKGYKSERLKQRLLNDFKDKIVFQKQPNPSKPELVYSSCLSLEDIINAAASVKTVSTLAIGTTSTQGLDEESVLYHASQILRSRIKSSVKGIDIQPVDVEDLTTARAKALVPKELYSFLCSIVSNAEQLDTHDPCPTATNAKEERQILAISQDIIFATSHGRAKLPKHVGVGVAVRHMTGSKQLVQMLNRLGHCCSYDDIEVIDTSLAMEVIAKSEAFGVVIPTNISPGPFVQVAADNNDFNEETLDGKQTTHATTLVVYQKKQFGPKPKTVVHADHSKKRRSFLVDKANIDILEFGASGKRPEVTQYQGQVDDEWFQYMTSLRCLNIQKDLGWLLMRMCPDTLSSTDLDIQENQSVPGWSAFNTMVSDEPPPPTNVGYCPLINGSSAEYSTIYTVMKYVQSMMDALGQEHSVITLDLAMYMKAKEIQWRRPDEFKNTVIRMGGFHIALNFLAVIGKLFKDSGIEDLLIESGVYGGNTASALLQGKSYNRGVRAHKLLSEAMLRLQWRAFIVWLTSQRRESNVEPVLDKEYIELVKACRETVDDEEALKTSYADLCAKVHLLQPDFERFREQSSERSKLFRFWDMYLKAVLLLLRFIRAEREGSWELHLNAVAEMVPYFFALDRINYARWLPVYLADMQMLPSRAPDVHQQFLDGNHAVCRSQQPFSQVWTDMALEQTINLDSKSRGGIIGLTQKESALGRWFITSHERASITSATKQLCDMDGSANVGHHKEAGSRRIGRDETDVQKILRTVSSNMINPFDVDQDVDPYPLSNIATGIAMPEDQAVRLLNCFEIGAEKRKKFVERMKTGVSFWTKITKVNVKTFSTLTKVKRMKCADEKVITISADRNLFGKLLIAAKCREIHLKDVLCYELSTVPYALAHSDGSLRKNAKSVLMEELEKECPPAEHLPADVLPTAHIVDGMALVQMLKTANCRTFGDLATKYLEVVCAPLKRRTCTRIDVVFDRYDHPLSIKESERQRRGASEALEIQISNRNLPVPKQWAKFVSNKRNKANLSDFLCTEWVILAPAYLSAGQELIIGGGFSDPLKAVRVTSSSWNVRVEELMSDHEEADTRIILHACHASTSMQRIIIHSPDTDVAVLATYSFSKMQCRELWFKTGVRDKVRYIPLHRLSENLGPSLCSALPGFHSLTGCDSTSALFMVGKRKAWKALKKDPTLPEILASLGNAVPLSPDIRKQCERFVCSLYTKATKAGHTADEVRYWMFCQKHQSSEALPPTSNSLLHHIERANYQALVWKRCFQAMQDLCSPVDNGWKVVNDVLEPVLMSRDPAPACLLELTTCRCSSKSACRRDDLCPCKGHAMPCTESCQCMNDDECQNPYRQSTMGEDEDEWSEVED